MPTWRRIASAAAVSCLSSAVPLPLPSGVARGQDGPASLLGRFAAGFDTVDPSAVAALFRPDGTLFGSAEPELLRGPEAVRGYFARSWPAGSRRRAECDVLGVREVSAGAAILEAWCRVEGEAPDGARRGGPLRVSALAVRDEAGWRFASLHASAAPAPRR